MNTRIVIIMYAIVVNLKLMQHNNWGIVGLQYANVWIQRRPQWLSVFAIRYHTCHLRFAALARQQALYMMCFAQTAQHLYSLVQTKNRLFFNIAGLTNRICDFSDVISWNKRNQWRGWFAAITWIITLDDVTHCPSVTRRQHGNLSELSFPSLGACQRLLVEMTSETWHLFALSVIAGADNQ